MADSRIVWRRTVFAVFAAAMVPAAVFADVRVWTDREEVILKGTLKGLEVVPDGSADKPSSPAPAEAPSGSPENSPAAPSEATPVPAVPKAPSPDVNRQVQRIGTPEEKLSVGDFGRKVVPGGLVILKRGHYFGGTITHPVTVRCEPGARIFGTDRKAALRIDASPVTIDGCQFRDSRKRMNSAGIWAEKGMKILTIRDGRFVNNGNGIIVGNRKGAVITIENSSFERNGAGGRAHQIYISGTDTELIIRRSTFSQTVGEGHVIKTGARLTVIEDTNILGSDQGYSRAIDAFAGGELRLNKVRIEHGPDANSDIIAFGAEMGRAPGRTEHRISFRDVVVRCLRLNGCTMVRTWLPEPRAITGVTVEDGTVRLEPTRM